MILGIFDPQTPDRHSARSETQSQNLENLHLNHLLQRGFTPLDPQNKRQNRCLLPLGVQGLRPWSGGWGPKVPSSNWFRGEL